MLVSGASLYIAALSELKFLFIEYVFILFMSILVSKFSLRIVFMIVGAGIGLFIGLQLFNTYFPGWEFTLDQIMDYAGTGGYSTETDLNRITALQTVTQNFLKNPVEFLMGMGLGSCETSSYFQVIFISSMGTDYIITIFFMLLLCWKLLDWLFPFPGIFYFDCDSCLEISTDSNAGEKDSLLVCFDRCCDLSDTMLL